MATRKYLSGTNGLFRQKTVEKKKLLAFHRRLHGFPSVFWQDQCQNHKKLADDLELESEGF
jgi:hypothetical protein